MKMDIVIAGVGGQGSVLASRSIAQAGIESNYQVRTSEVIGMAQREGQVTSHIRIARELYGAIIPDGQADILLGLELAETARNLNKLKPDGVVIAGTSAIIPVSVELGLSSYDKDALISYIKKNASKTFFIDIENLSLQAGSIKSGNVVLMGALSALGNLPFSPEQLLKAILSLLPEKIRDINNRAFQLGQQAMEVA